MNKPIWINPKIMSWFAHDDGGSIFEPTRRQRAYEILKRAEFFLDCDTVPTEHDRADCLSNLRRCINHRLEFLEEEYSLKSNLIRGRNTHYFELLRRVGAVRPTMLNGLLAIRNDVEYRDLAPPEVKRCRELVDVVWYFLRSTDHLLQVHKAGAMLTPPDADPWDSTYWVKCDIDFVPKFACRMNGWLRPEWISTSGVEDYLHIKTSVFHTKSEKFGAFEQHLDKDDDDIWFIGDALLTESQKERIIVAALGSA